MPFRISIPLVIVAAFAVFGLVGGSSKIVGNDNVIKIVSSLPRSGSARGQTDSIVNGIKLAFHEVNYEIEIEDPETKVKKKYKIEYMDLDDATAAAGQWTIEQEIANANQARNDPDVMVYIGTYNSGAAKVSMPVLNNANMLMISPANTSPALTMQGFGERHEPKCYRPNNNKVNYTRVVPTDDVQSGVSALWAKELGVKKLYILDDNEVYGKGIADQFKTNCIKLGIEVLGQESIDSKQQEFRPLLQKIKEKSPELIYFGGTTQTKAGQILKDMISVELKCPMMAPDGCYEMSMISSAGLDTFKKIKFYVTFGGLPVDGLIEGRGPMFVKNYTELYGAPPTEAYAAYGYECSLVALDAIRRAGKKDREAIRVAGINTKKFNGTIGQWSFDANGDTDSKKMSGNTVVIEKNDKGEEVGKFKFERSLEMKQSGTP